MGDSLSDPQVAATAAIRDGAVEVLRGLLTEHPSLAAARMDPSRSLLHVATDWPGPRPNVSATIAALVEAGADVNARFVGPHAETPLHWAASSDDIAALDALLDAGADIEAPGAAIGGGTPIADATAFGQWNAARRLIERGARTTLWSAAALGLQSRMEDHLAAAPPPTADQIAEALWAACHGGQLRTAKYLLERGADPSWIGHDGLTAAGAADREGHPELVTWLTSPAPEARDEPGRGGAACTRRSESASPRWAISWRPSGSSRR